MIKWFKAFILGIIIWYVLTIVYGTFVGVLDLDELSFFNSNSNLHNFILYPFAVWLSFKITKTSFWGNSKDKKKKQLFDKQMEEISKGEEEEFSKVKDNNSDSLVENQLVSDLHISSMAWTAACWRLTIENKTNKMMLEKKVVKFCRLFLEQEKKRNHIKDYNRADVRILKIAIFGCSLDEVDKLIVKNAFTYEVAKAFENEIGYK